jgi:acetyltransferase-like isoleucine patch superfamily enzyme/dTDP-4-dehydrorhamnose 3,5-epimerase-like enzyme
MTGATTDDVAHSAPDGVFVHPQGICESTAVGTGTHVWAFAHVLPGAIIGEDCNLNDGVFVENDVRLGNRVTVKCGVQVWDGVTLEDDVFVGPNATFSNDHFPRSKARPDAFLTTIVRRGASIGANATILPGLEIGSGAMIGAGSVVTRSVPANAIVVGNPARIIGYAGTEEVVDLTATTPEPGGSSGSVHLLGVGTSALHDLPVARDLRGSLAVAEFHALPFAPQRCFVVHDVPGKEVRGEHAHRECEQFLVCVQGSCAALLDDGCTRCEVLLDSSAKGLYVPPMVWGTQYRYSRDAVLLVFASHVYDPQDYIRDYQQFRDLARSRHRRTESHGVTQR